MAQSSYFTGPLYTRMAEDLHLGGMSERTAMCPVRWADEGRPHHVRAHRGVQRTRAGVFG